MRASFFGALSERAATLDWRGPQDFPALLQRLFSAASPPMPTRCR